MSGYRVSPADQAINETAAELYRSLTWDRGIGIDKHMTNYDDVHFASGDVIFDTNKPLEHAYFILEGSAEVSLTLRNRHISVPLAAGQFIGDIAVAVTNKDEIEHLHYKGKAVATESVTATVIPIEDLKRELSECPPMIKAWIGSFINRTLIVINELSKD